MGDELKMNAGKQIVNAYMQGHPEAMDGVKRATYAYHLGHREAGAHFFSGSSKDSACRWCGQTREGVRWDWYGLPPTCQHRPKWADEGIEGAIAKEEAQFERVLERAKELASKVDLATLTGKELARIHHTYGVDPSMLEAALMMNGQTIPQSLHDAYQSAYSLHRSTGKRGLVREVIVAKTANDKAQP